MSCRRKLAVVSVLAGSAWLAGCASMAISDEKLVHKTAFGLGLSESDITIVSRENNGFMTSYTVQSKAGKKYNCQVAGTLGTVGEPGCEEVGPGASSCNALLKAAGKC